mmetsp:Transcript_13408/g.22841  ORF Transcript_13408/g.22841 Transcript_13408/m.22841 type:complete len:225 (-) Transcript_13408:191-865(-)
MKYQLLTIATAFAMITAAPAAAEESTSLGKAGILKGADFHQQVNEAIAVHKGGEEGKGDKDKKGSKEDRADKDDKDDKDEKCDKQCQKNRNKSSKDSKDKSSKDSYSSSSSSSTGGSGSSSTSSSSSSSGDDKKDRKKTRKYSSDDRITKDMCDEEDIKSADKLLCTLIWNETCDPEMIKQKRGGEKKDDEDDCEWLGFGDDAPDYLIPAPPASEMVGRKFIRG